MPLISVIVPVYNVLPYLDRCISSLLNQTYRDLDILLIDDGSTDGCASRCDEYAQMDSRIRVIHQANAGLSMARNTGLEHARGQFVAFVDSDDYVDIHMLEQLYRALSTLQADTCFCRYCNVSVNGRVQPAAEKYQRTVYSGTQIKELLLGMVGSRPHFLHDVEIGMSVWKGLYSTLLLQHYNIRFLSEREYLSEDLLFHLHYLSHAEKVATIPDFLYFYCQNKNSLTGCYRPDRFELEKTFYQILSVELSKYFPSADYQQRLEKAFMGRVRHCIQQEATRAKCAPSKSLIPVICRDPLVQAVLDDLDPDQLPPAKRMLHWLIQTEQTTFLFLFFHFR